MCGGSAPKPLRLRRAFKSPCRRPSDHGALPQTPLGAPPLRPRREGLTPGPTLAGAAAPRPRFFLEIKIRPAALMY